MIKSQNQKDSAPHVLSHCISNNRCAASFYSMSIWFCLSCTESCCKCNILQCTTHQIDDVQAAPLGQTYNNCSCARNMFSNFLPHLSTKSWSSDSAVLACTLFPAGPEAPLLQAPLAKCLLEPQPVIMHCHFCHQAVKDCAAQVPPPGDPAPCCA